MSKAIAKGNEIAPSFLRALTVNPKLHPRTQPHISAASGLVCVHGRAYVISDDEHHLAMFRDRSGPGQLYRIVPDNLPKAKQARKRRKPDFEVLLRLPSNGLQPMADGLVALGSGSRSNRQTGVFIPLDQHGVPSKRVRRFDLAPLYQPLRTTLGEINVEGALVLENDLLLLNRGVAGRTDNATARYRLADFAHLIEGKQSSIKPIEIRRYDLGTIEGVGLSFTDGAALPGGRWVYTAVAESTDDSYADGPCVGSAVGAVNANGELQEMRVLAPPSKVEGIDVQVINDETLICLVTDSDEPKQSSTMWLARL